MSILPISDALLITLRLSLNHLTAAPVIATEPCNATFQLSWHNWKISVWNMIGWGWGHSQINNNSKPFNKNKKSSHQVGDWLKLNRWSKIHLFTGKVFCVWFFEPVTHIAGCMRLRLSTAMIIIFQIVNRAACVITVCPSYIYM